jgi:hypothetical protein
MASFFGRIACSDSHKKPSRKKKPLFSHLTDSPQPVYSQKCEKNVKSLSPEQEKQGFSGITCNIHLRKRDLLFQSFVIIFFFNIFVVVKSHIIRKSHELESTCLSNGGTPATHRHAPARGD